MSIRLKTRMICSKIKNISPDKEKQSEANLKGKTKQKILYLNTDLQLCELCLLSTGSWVTDLTRFPLAATDQTPRQGGNGQRALMQFLTTDQKPSTVHCENVLLFSHGQTQTDTETHTDTPPHPMPISPFHGGPYSCHRHTHPTPSLLSMVVLTSPTPSLLKLYSNRELCPHDHRKPRKEPSS